MPVQTSTPLPAPPVKIQRGKAAPPRTKYHTRRKKRPNPFVLLFRELLRRLYFGIKISYKALLLLPIPLFMVAFSYHVDRSGFYQGALAPRRIVDLMLAGKDVTNFEQMDERTVVQLYAQDVPETPEVIGIGSSRVLQFTREIVGSDSFFNMGVTGADVRDAMTSYYKMVCYGKAPKVLLWSVDPWVFHGGENSLDSRADANLYNEFLTKVLNIPTNYKEPISPEAWEALADPAYFQGNFDYYLKNRNSDTVVDADGKAIEFNAVTGNVFDQTATVKRSDGSVLYDVNYRNRTLDEIRNDAIIVRETIDTVHMMGFDHLDTTQVKAFEAFIDYAHAQGTTVVLVLAPWHSYLYDYMLTETEKHQGFFDVELYVRQYCAENKIPLYGSYDPSLIEGLGEEDFYDGIHCRGSGFEKLFPGVQTVLEQIATDTLPDPLALTPRTGHELSE
ncbi:hypothetical protein [uncultured Gemmiger sp.]|uniref:hypothetical protein n=1 Tax=uncultured Gemmiger sp. TaxID=1623490 RepID=UPI0025E7B04D|nr:hypothetical protein [uncultured Gemmiger sp.]